ncbi:MAG: oxidoreductase [Candidatus Hydrogenedentota bacterium]
MPSESCPVVIVTGGGQGIGKCAVRRFLEKGYAVVFAENDPEAGQDTESELKDLGPVCWFACDVACENQVGALVAETVKRYGGVNVLVNNAAIAANGSLETLSLQRWDRVLAVNLTGPYLCARHAVPYLRDRKGSIINVASTRAFMSEAGTEAYSASKGGILALTHALAASLAPEVRVNCISPGWIETAEWRKSSERGTANHSEADRMQHWSGRVGTPDDVVSLMMYLAGAESGFITGSNFVVDGGMTRKMIYA